MMRRSVSAAARRMVRSTVFPTIDGTIVAIAVTAAVAAGSSTPWRTTRWISAAATTACIPVLSSWRSPSGAAHVVIRIVSIRLLRIAVSRERSSIGSRRLGR